MHNRKLSGWFQKGAFRAYKIVIKQLYDIRNRLSYVLESIEYNSL